MIVKLLDIDGNKVVVKKNMDLMCAYLKNDAVDGSYTVKVGMDKVIVHKSEGFVYSDKDWKEMERL